MDGPVDRPDGRRAFHVSAADPICPLCGTGLDIPAEPQMPCGTLEVLARHFEDGCTATAHLGRDALSKPAWTMSEQDGHGR